MFHRQGLGGKLEADLSEFEDAREVVAALSEEYAAAESSDYVSAAMYRVCSARLLSHSLLDLLLRCLWSAADRPHSKVLARHLTAGKCANHVPLSVPCPQPTPAPPAHPLLLQIDRADGSAADLATQLASHMNLGGAAGGGLDPRAPVRA